MFLSRYVKGVPFFSGRYAKGVPFLSKKGKMLDLGVPPSLPVSMWWKACSHGNCIGNNVFIKRIVFCITTRQCMVPRLQLHFWTEHILIQTSFMAMKQKPSWGTFITTITCHGGRNKQFAWLFCQKKSRTVPFL